MFQYLFDTSGFPARWYCGTGWSEEPFWGYLHIAADLGIFGAYIAIPIALLFFVLRRSDIVFPRVFILFVAFIFACGSTHLVEALIFQWPIYRFSGVLKLLTAVVSWATVFALVRIAPRALALRSPGDLESEVGRRTQQYEELAESFRQEAFLRERMARSLLENEERMRLVLHVAEIGCWDWDLKTGSVQFDPNQTLLTGLGAETGVIQAEEFFAHVHPEDRAQVREATQRSVRDRVAYSSEFRYLHPDGNEIWLIGRGAIVVDESGRHRLAGVNIDVTARKRIELELVEAQRLAEGANRAKSQFVANMSHEIRTPLTAILGCADLLVRDSTDEDSRAMAEMIRNQGQLLHGILNDVLDVSKMEAGKLDIKKTDVSLTNLLADVRSLMEPTALEKGLEFSAAFATPVPPIVRTDPLRVRQILLNLVGNAVKFTPAGAVQVDCSFLPADDGDGGVLSIRVRDTGPGIPQDKVDAIFEPFTQVESKNQPTIQGTGLGLTICQRLADMLGGEIAVRTTPGSGSEFELRLPLEEALELQSLNLEAADPGRVVEAPAESEESVADARVLVAEDTRSIQALLRRMLQGRVGTVTVVGDGQAAVDELERAARAGDAYDVVLMDMQMPVLDGYSATRKLRESGYDVPIVALTASAMSGDRETCERAGCNGYLTKPVDRRELLAELTRWIQGSRASR